MRFIALSLIHSPLVTKSLIIQCGRMAGAQILDQENFRVENWFFYLLTVFSALYSFNSVDLSFLMYGVEEIMSTSPGR